MSSKLRVFISSTMKDLANERNATAEKVQQFNFEPVNAEGWLPDGSKSWTRIEEELLSSHLMVLILGERYGWIPTEGPGANRGLSVTHMEVEAARRADIPILPFLKRLDYDSPRDSEDAKKRDALRAEVRSWHSGLLTSKFNLAKDLSEKIGAALVGVLSESYLKEKVRSRDERTISLAPEQAPSAISKSPALDSELLSALRQKQAVLLVGAGMSLSAGYPGAQALSELYISDAAQRGATGINLGLTGSIQDIAENFERAYGRQALLALLQSSLSPPQSIKPTLAHRLAVRIFNTILTTNLDNLLEATCEEESLDYTAIAGDVNALPPADQRIIIKIAGSVSRPESVIITAADARFITSKKPRLWCSLLDLVATRPLVIVAHSLRDISARALIDARPRRGVPGYIVGNEIGSFDELRFKNIGLTPIHADANTFFRTCADMLLGEEGRPI